MGDIVTFRKKGRPYADETLEDMRDEVTALRAEMAGLVAAVRPVIAQLAVIGVNQSPAVLPRARALAGLIDRVERRSFVGGAA